MSGGDWPAGIPEEYRNQIVTGDARVLAERIPDESVDLIFADPVYERVKDYEWLAETAARVLTEDGALLAWGATSYLPEYMKVLGKFLGYVWTLHCQSSKGISNYNGKTGLCIIAQCYWFDKSGTSKCHKRIADWARDGGGKQHGGFKWSKPMNVVMKWTDAFTKESAIIFDPFTGGGAVPAVCKQLGRRYIAFEIDPATAEAARERVRLAQPPLFVPEPEQLELRYQ